MTRSIRPLFILATIWATALVAGAAPATQPAPAQAIATRALDLDGAIHAIGAATTRPTALVFLGTECPISRRYIPVLNALLAHAQDQRVQLLGVISDPTVSRAAAQQYRRDYAVAFPIIFDASGELARSLKPSVTPHAFVIDTSGSVVYDGRIDDNYFSVARQKETVEHHEFADAIDAAATGVPPAVRQTPPIGCAFEAWDKPLANSQITYSRNVAPILMANCVSCHHAGEVAPFPLTAYMDAAKRAEQIAAVTQSRFMPPWKATAGFGHFIGARCLSDEEIATLSAWAAAGAPQGDASDLPPAPTFSSGWKLGTPDLVLTMPQPFNVPAGGNDIYRAFVLPMDVPQDMYVAGVQFVAGAPSVVHHSLLFLDTTGEGRRRQAAATDGPGYPTFGGIGFQPTGGLGGWAPGAEPYLLPDGVGRLVRKGSDLVMQIHYHPDGRPHADQSKVAIYFAKKKIEHILGSILVGTSHIDIPAGDADFVLKKGLLLPVDLTILGVTPHMHLLGREMKLIATKPDGSVTPLIWVKDWDFRWQDQYRFAQPIHLPKGTRLHLVAVYDNSANNPANPNSPPRRVGNGEQTTDEMCLCFVSILANSPADLRRLLVAVALAN